MNKTVGLMGALTVALIVIDGAPVHGQEQTIALNLFAPPVRPKAPVYLNTTLTNPTEVQVFELRQTLSFRRAHLRFVGAELGVAGYLSDATLTVELQDASGTRVEDKDAAEQVQIRITTTLPMAPGPLVEFEFRQVEDREQSIKMSQAAEIRDGEGKPVPGLVYSNPDVTVSNDLEPLPLKVFGCFFYMH